MTHHTAFILSPYIVFIFDKSAEIVEYYIRRTGCRPRYCLQPDRFRFEAFKH
jgi:hypothetical protein